MGVIESVAEEAAPFRLTCWGVSEIVYPEMTNEESVNVTELDIWLVGVTVIAAEPCCPATGCRFTPFTGASVKSGMLTFTKTTFELEFA